jgi:tight adherence protein C
MDPILLGGLAAIFLGISMAIGTLATIGAGRSGVARAISDINQVYAPSAAGRLSTADRALQPLLATLARVGRGLTPRSARAWMLKWLDYAGNPPAWPPERIYEMQGLGLVVIGTVGGLIGLVVALIGGSGWIGWPVGLALVGALTGLALPNAIVLEVGQRRQEEVRRTLPDALDMLTLSVEAGVGFDGALHHVAARTRGPLAREISRALNEMQMGKDRAEAMRALAERTSIRELRTIAIAIVQATELGVPLAGVLREQASEMRVKRRQHAEEQARKVPVKILFPLVFCLFPALFIVVIGPGIIRIMDAFL